MDSFVGSLKFHERGWTELIKKKLNLSLRESPLSLGSSHSHRLIISKLGKDGWDCPWLLYPEDRMPAKVLVHNATKSQG